MFATRSKKFSFVLLLAASALSFQSKAATIFQDGFESGALGTIQNAARWSDSNHGPADGLQVSADRARTGKYSLKFTYGGGASTDDAWSEQRFKLGGQYKEVWFKYDLYIPDNYNHRSVSPSNNKFLALYAAPYTENGFESNFSTSANGSGGSNLGMHYEKSESSSDEKVSYPESGKGFITTADRGKWVSIKVHLKVPSGNFANDGVMQLWKNDVPVIDVRNLDNYGLVKNYIDEIYILGWSNSGYTETTSFYLDNFIFSDTPIGGTSPAAPTNLVVQ